MPLAMVFGEGKYAVSVRQEIIDVPYARNGHDGFDYQYTESVINKVASWISDNDHPSCIYAAGKAYHVRYRWEGVANSG